MNINELRRIVIDKLKLAREMKYDEYATASEILDALADVRALNHGNYGEQSGMQS